MGTYTRLRIRDRLFIWPFYFTRNPVLPVVTTSGYEPPLDLGPTNYGVGIEWPNRRENLLVPRRHLSPRKGRAPVFSDKANMNPYKRTA